MWKSYTAAHKPLNSLSDRSENWFIPYLADFGDVENEFKYACRFLDSCNHTNEESCDTMLDRVGKLWKISY